MKKIALTLFILTSCSLCWGQEVLYTFVYNKASAGARVPVMVGAVNVAYGPQSGVQCGFYNQCGEWIRGAQFGFANVIQRGLEPTRLNGAQFGFYNQADLVTGAQFGFVNPAATLDGAQFGFVNPVKEHVEGAQFGFVNPVGGNLRGVQFGFVNTARTVDGFQCGFVNIADKFERGVPLGFISIVKEGGYQAVEYAINDLYPFNFSLMTGLPKLYSIFKVSVNPWYDSHQVAYGFGVGSIIDLGKQFSFMPEATMLNTLEKNESQSILSIDPTFGYDLGHRLTLVVAPTLSWQFAPKGSVVEEPFIPMGNFSIDDRNRINIGVRIGLRCNLSKGGNPAAH